RGRDTLSLHDALPISVADRRELLERGIGGAERLFRLAEPVLLHHGATEHELAHADLVEVVLAPLEQAKRVACLLLREDGISSAQDRKSTRLNSSHDQI